MEAIERISDSNAKAAPRLGDPLPRLLEIMFSWAMHTLRQQATWKPIQYVDIP
jgi:hypothetical protein